MNAILSLQPSLQQTLAVSQKLIQSIEILEFDQEELEAFVADQVERNPLLKLGTAGSESRPAPLRGLTGIAQTESPVLEDTLSAETTLATHLHWQLALADYPARARALAALLIDSLEPDGYLRDDLFLLADLFSAGESETTAALRIVQRLEPAGVGARTLTECLWLQLRNRPGLDPAFERLLDNTDLIAAGEVKRLAKACKLSENRVREMIRDLRSLDPTPGLAFSTEPPLPALPDIIVSMDRNGLPVAEINSDLLPRVLIDRGYEAQLVEKIHEKADKRFLKDCVRDASLLIRNLEQRYNTLLRIGREIVRVQKRYFLHGITEMRPLRQKDIARELGIHDSTVSRGIANKHILCVHGLVPIKFFFPDRVGDSETPGGDHASETIRYRIRDIVGKESSSGIQSDEDIAASLAQEGIAISRRTVAKYRGQMRILTSGQRRRLARLTGA